MVLRTFWTKVGQDPDYFSKSAKQKLDVGMAAHVRNIKEQTCCLDVMTCCTLQMSHLDRA